MVPRKETNWAVYSHRKSRWRRRGLRSMAPDDSTDERPLALIFFYAKFLPPSADMPQQGGLMKTRSLFSFALLFACAWLSLFPLPGLAQNDPTADGEEMAPEDVAGI